MDEEKSAAELAAQMEAEGIDAVLGGRPEDDTSGNPGESEQATDEAASAAEADAGQQSQAGTQDDKTTAQAPAADGGTAADSDEAPILGGGGKTIPYAVLKETRQRAATAAQEAESARAEVAELKAQLETLRAGAGGAAAEAAQQVAQGADAEALYDDLPAPLADKLRKLDATQAELNAAVNRLAQREQQQVQAEQQTVAEQTQAVIDAIPTLAEWQAKGGPEWQAAVAADNRLMQNPAWANKPLADRIAKAAEIAALELGLPAPPPPNVTKPNQTARTAAAARPVASLTDISGGGMPAVDSRDYMEGASTAQLAARMNNMSPDELDRWLRETG